MGLERVAVTIGRGDFQRGGVMEAKDVECAVEIGSDTLASGFLWIVAGELFQFVGGLLAQRERCAGNDLFVYFDHGVCGVVFGFWRYRASPALPEEPPASGFNSLVFIDASLKTVQVPYS